MSTDPLDAALSALAAAKGEASFAQAATRAAKAMLETPGAAAGLARRLVTASNSAPIGDMMALWAALLDEARMARENGFAAADRAMREVEAEIASLGAKGALDMARRAALAQGYAAAGLPTPAVLMIDDAAMAATGRLRAATPGDAGGELDAMVEKLLRDADGEPLRAHAQLAGSLAALPDDARAMAFAAVAQSATPAWTRIGLYSLFDRAAAVRDAVAAAFEARARQGALDDQTAASLVLARRHMPDDPARARLDRAIKAALRADSASAPPPANWTVHRVLALPPDGAGALSLAAAVQRGGRRAVVFLMPKQGHGLKDAFLAPCASATEQRAILARAYEDLEPIEVDAGLPARLVRLALGEGIAEGAPPPPGLIDVAEIWGQAELTPAGADAAAVLAMVDPEGEIAALSPQAAGRLINHAVEETATVGMTETWFEDNEAVRALVLEARTPRQLETALWRYLDTRRAWWARHWAVVALVLRAAARPRGDWRVFAATAQAMLAGRAMNKTPLMLGVFAGTVMAMGARAAAAAPDAGVEPEWLERGGFMPATPEQVRPPARERKGEFARLIKDATLTEAWLDGYLAASAVAPLLAPPTEWLGAILDRMAFADEAAFHRFVEIVVLRANDADGWCADAAAISGRLAALGDAGRCDWAAGFAAFVSAMRHVWPKRMLRAEDRRIIAALDAAPEAGLSSDLALALPGWIAKRHEMRE
ncbi:UPF0149 family protein [Rubrimonas sp.]|uniref:UPF0149 family protein n=1 Tax=Rubrimonas sp. TaxID=2036015 RepID=UPI002FDDB0F7